VDDDILAVAGLEDGTRLLAHIIDITTRKPENRYIHPVDHPKSRRTE